MNALRACESTRAKNIIVIKSQTEKTTMNVRIEHIETKPSNAFRKVLLVIMALLAFCEVNAQEGVAKKDSVDENFVIASVLLAEPGGALYSNAGHVTLRLQCPDHKLDYVFSYESENVSKKILSFLSGNLKMGMFAIPTAEPTAERIKPQRDVNFACVVCFIGISFRQQMLLDLSVENFIINTDICQINVFY